MPVIFVSIGAACAKVIGGLFALKFKDRLHLILGFSAGTMIGVAFFDLLPESLGLTEKSFDHGVVTSIIALGFVLFMVIDRVIAHYSPSDKSFDECGHSTHHAGKLGAIALIIHSFLDGLVIGLAFQVSAVVGLIVATAITIHGFSDGVNTVSLILRGSNDNKVALRWLAMSALAPVLGTASTFLFTLPEAALGIILSVFCGSFIYIGASDLLPESHHRHPTPWTTISTILGLLVIYIAISIAG